jgi:hypothetical protein
MEPGQNIIHSEVNWGSGYFPQLFARGRETLGYKIFDLFLKPFLFIDKL